jgi:hypothetical protein
MKWPINLNIFYDFFQIAGMVKRRTEVVEVAISCTKASILYRQNGSAAIGVIRRGS